MKCLTFVHLLVYQVRTIFAKILIFLCHVSKGDGECDPPYVLEEKETSKGNISGKPAS